jgi:hypothetical protein
VFVDLLVEFGRTGRIGPLRCGMWLSEAEDLLGGHPDEWGDLELTTTGRQITAMAIRAPAPDRRITLPARVLPDRTATAPVLLDDLTLALNAAGARHELRPIGMPRQRLLHIEPGGVAASFAAMPDGRFYLLVMHKSADLDSHPGPGPGPEIEVGETYRVHLPKRSDVGRFLTDPMLLMWVLGEAEDFELTVESTDATLHGEPAVVGVRFTDTVHVSTPLPRDAAAQLGLPSNVDYLVRGVLVDAVSGQVVQLPTEETLTIPVEWLRPLG